MEEKKTEDFPPQFPETMTHEEKAKANGMRFTVSETPSIPECVLLGLQHYMIMLGATVLIPLLIVPAMGGTMGQTARVINTIFFTSGLNTLVQTTFGDRLPIVQGGSFAFLTPTFTIIGEVAKKCSQGDGCGDRFEETMQTIQGAIIVSGIVQICMAYSGLMTVVLRYISPITIAPTVASIGLGLYGAGFGNVGACPEVGLVQIMTIIVFSQYLKNIEVPLGPLGNQKLFALFPVLFGIIFTWIWAAILTAADAWDKGGSHAICRTDNDSVMDETPWFRIPYPGQWGAPKFESFAIAPIFGAALASMVESVGDYYACAMMSGAPPPTGTIISRGLGGEGFGLIIAGLLGTGNGTTSYGENIGALSVTRVGSRAVVQAGACVMVLFGIIAKVGALFASMPPPMVGGLYCSLFGLIAAVGISNLQYTDMNSSRNLFILGFALFNSLSVPDYFAKYGGNPFDTGDADADAVFLSLFSTPMIIAFLSAFVLDNTIPGTRKERGLQVWDKVRAEDKTFDPEYQKVYDLPFGLMKVVNYFSWLVWLETGKWPEPPPEGSNTDTANPTDATAIPMQTQA